MLLKDFPFSEETGYTGTKKIETIADAYTLLFDENIMDLICRETNRYVDQEFNRLSSIAKKKNKKLSKRVRDWRPLTIPELKIYLGLRIMMGCNQVSMSVFFLEIYLSLHRKIQQAHIGKLMMKILPPLGNVFATTCHFIAFRISLDFFISPTMRISRKTTESSKSAI